MKVEFSFYDGQLRETLYNIVNLLDKQVFQRAVYILHKWFCITEHMGWNMTAIY